MADKKIEKDKEAAIQSASIASGSTKTLGVMIAWTTGGSYSKQDVLNAVDDLRDTLSVTADGSF
jgi:hypothetical protein